MNPGTISVDTVAVAQLVNSPNPTETIVDIALVSQEVIGATIGIPGPQGVPGRDGVGDLHFTYSQSIPSAVWTIAHNLGKFPSVSIVDSTGRAVRGAINYIDSNNLTVSFVAGFSGKAYLN